MEIINQTPPEPKSSQDILRPRNLFLGMTLIVVGILWLFNNLDLIPDRLFDMLISWQILLIVIGGFLLSQQKWASGGIVILIGLAFFVIKLAGWYVPVNKVMLPVLFIGIGLAIILSRLEKK